VVEVVLFSSQLDEVLVAVVGDRHCQSELWLSAVSNSTAYRFPAIVASPKTPPIIVASSVAGTSLMKISDHEVLVPISHFLMLWLDAVVAQ
jgi:hypothetical protein